MACVAGHFPQGDETAMRRCADVWADTAQQCAPLAEQHLVAARAIQAASAGEAVDQLARSHLDFAENWRAQQNYCDSMARQLHEGATGVEFQKLVCIFTAATLAGQLARDGLAFAAGGALMGVADRIAADATLSALRKRVLEWLAGAGAKAAAERSLLVLAAKSALVGMTLGGLVNLGAQGVQIMEGNRDGIDLTSARVAVIAGGAGGAAGALTGHVLAPRITTLFGRHATSPAGRLLAHLGGTVFLGGAGGIAGGVAGTGVSLILTGQAFTRQAFTEGVIPGFAGGFLGAAGAAMRARPMPTPAGVPRMPLPDPPGAHAVQVSEASPPGRANVVSTYRDPPAPAAPGTGSGRTAHPDPFDYSTTVPPDKAALRTRPVTEVATDPVAAPPWATRTRDPGKADLISSGNEPKHLSTSVADHRAANSPAREPVPAGVSQRADAAEPVPAGSETAWTVASQHTAEGSGRQDARGSHSSTPHATESAAHNTTEQSRLATSGEPRANSPASPTPPRGVTSAPVDRPPNPADGTPAGPPEPHPEAVETHSVPTDSGEGHNLGTDGSDGPNPPDDPPSTAPASDGDPDRVALGALAAGDREHAENAAAAVASLLRDWPANGPNAAASIAETVTRAIESGDGTIDLTAEFMAFDPNSADRSLRLAITDTVDENHQSMTVWYFDENPPPLTVDAQGKPTLPHRSVQGTEATRHHYTRRVSIERRALGAQLTQAGWPESHIGNAQLIHGEVYENAVGLTPPDRSPVIYRSAIDTGPDGPRLRISVTDHIPGRPTEFDPNNPVPSDKSSGRGGEIRFKASHGTGIIEHGDGSKSIWFELRRNEAAPSDEPAAPPAPAEARPTALKPAAEGINLELLRDMGIDVDGLADLQAPARAADRDIEAAALDDLAPVAQGVEMPRAPFYNGARLWQCEQIFPRAFGEPPEAEGYIRTAAHSSVGEVVYLTEGADGPHRETGAEGAHLASVYGTITRWTDVRDGLNRFHPAGMVLGIDSSVQARPMPAADHSAKNFLEGVSDRVLTASGRIDTSQITSVQFQIYETIIQDRRATLVADGLPGLSDLNAASVSDPVVIRDRINRLAAAIREHYPHIDVSVATSHLSVEEAIRLFEAT